MSELLRFEERFSVHGYVTRFGLASLSLNDAWTSPGDPPSVELTKDQLHEVIDAMIRLWKAMP